MKHYETEFWALLIMANIHVAQGDLVFGAVFILSAIIVGILDRKTKIPLE